MLERVDFFIRDISAIPVADTARIWSRCLNEINHLKNRKNSLVRPIRRPDGRPERRRSPGRPEWGRFPGRADETRNNRRRLGYW